MINEFFDKHNNITNDIAIGVSGGADSMALCFALSKYLPEATIHALTVDHGLRDASADEALHVAQQLSNLSNVTHKILKWDHCCNNKPVARIQELARKARYELMAKYMNNHKIIHLFLGHHMDDQAETFLFRLAKGSGIDGLSCMSPIQETDMEITLCRPMLKLQKQEILDYCTEKNIKFIDDPSNDSEVYARVRLRKSMDILKEEGLTPKRLSVCAARHARAKQALNSISDNVFNECMVSNDNKIIVFNSKILLDNPEEIILRVILLAMSELNPNDGYGARMERVENLCQDFINYTKFRKRTLGGIIFEHNSKNNQFILYLEPS